MGGGKRSPKSRSKQQTPTCNLSNGRKLWKKYEDQGGCRCLSKQGHSVSEHRGVAYSGSKVGEKKKARRAKTAKMQESLLSMAIGAALSFTGAFFVHKSVWQSSLELAEKIEAIHSNHINSPEPPQSEPVSFRKRSHSCSNVPPKRFLQASILTLHLTMIRWQAFTFEQYLAQRAGITWNRMVDSAHHRLLVLPDTFAKIGQDVQEKFKELGSSKE